MARPRMHDRRRLDLMQAREEAAAIDWAPELIQSVRTGAVLQARFSLLDHYAADRPMPAYLRAHVVRAVRSCDVRDWAEVVDVAKDILANVETAP
jgi:hypothetical protein